MVSVGKEEISHLARSVCIRLFKERKYSSEQTFLQASRQPKQRFLMGWRAKMEHAFPICSLLPEQRSRERSAYWQVDAGLSARIGNGEWVPTEIWDAAHAPHQPGGFRTAG